MTDLSKNIEALREKKAVIEMGGGGAASENNMNFFYEELPDTVNVGGLPGSVSWLCWIRTLSMSMTCS